ncbi:receptor-like kinase TMK2 [Capsella rubella]|uniref:receptor-like kinase TMK2 n=1 Tax=Capsella rubella TaxID=81985 RepID=UPI000CD5538F|nr:receptor-like kinase TMK2 [Capsella rubella]XP_023634776.1 receptor-like kinase TMK2 [Capsella rubella]
MPHFKNVVPNTQGNPDLKTNHVLVPSPTRNNNKSVFVLLLLGIVVGLVISGAVAIGLYLFRKRTQSNNLPLQNETVTHAQQSGDEIMETESYVIPFQLLREATEGFSQKNMLGTGGFGSVYRGKLQNGNVEIAVKRMGQRIGGRRGLEEFQSEVQILTKVYHRNLVVLQGYCLEGNERLLVYRYMPQGSLSRHLFHWKDEGLKPLEWTRRLTIALDVARGVEYLHTLALDSQSYIHRDLKPENILLGDDMRAKVSDFGLARSTEEGRHSIRTKCVGTPGYIAPEYAMYGRVTAKADVYSFGIILMELVTAQQALDEKRSEADHHISSWLRKVFLDKESFERAIDETIELNDETRSSVDEVSVLANHCCAKELAQRPDMSYVVSTLTSLVVHWKPCEIEEKDEDRFISEMIKDWKERELQGSSSSITVV